MEYYERYVNYLLVALHENIANQRKVFQVSRAQVISALLVSLDEIRQRGQLRER